MQSQPDLSELLQSWWRGETLSGAVAMAFLIALLRSIYGGSGWKKMLLDALICGALTLTFASALTYFSLPSSLSVAIGGCTGFIGTDSLRALVLRFIGKQMGVDDGRKS